MNIPSACEILYDNALYKFTLHYITYPVNSAVCSVPNFRVRFTRINLTNKTIGENKFDRPEVKKTVKIIRSQMKISALHSVGIGLLFMQRVSCKTTM